MDRRSDETQGLEPLREEQRGRHHFSILLTRAHTVVFRPPRRDQLGGAEE
jgi:hypothetical protein